MGKKEIKLAKKLIRIAHAHPERAPSLKPKIHALLGRTSSHSKLSARQRRDLAEAKALVWNTVTAASSTSITKMPGFSPMQLRAQIEQLGKVKLELQMMTAQYEDALKKMKGLEKEEKKGMAILKDAATQMREKGNYIVDAENALIQFNTYITAKRPGIKQMIEKPEDSKWGDKAGDFFGRVAAKLGAEVGAAVQEIYNATAEDLTHSTMAVKGLKLVLKTSSLNTETLKTAGIMDAVINVKEWLAGNAHKLFNFMGDIGRWLKGFVERTKLVRKKKDDLQKAIKSAQGQVDKLLAGAL